MLTENSLILVELETITGTDPTPSSTSNFLAVHNIVPSPNLGFNDTLAQDGSLSPRANTLGAKHVEITFDHELQVDNSNKTIPPCDALLQACGWDDKEESITDGKYYPASPRGLKCIRVPYDSGGTTEIAVGDTVTGQDSGAQAIVLTAKQVSGTWAGGDSAGFLYVWPTLRTPGVADQTTGSGLSDLTMGSTYTDHANTTFEIEIDAAATPDTFKWRQDSGSWTSTVSITGSAQTLADGVTVTFGATTGHTLADAWTITCNDTFENDEAILVSTVDCGTVNGTQIAPSVTIWVYHENVVWKITGCKGDVAWKLTAGQPAILSFRMIGQYAKPTDTTFPVSWTDSGGAPLVAMGGTFAYGTERPVIESLSFGLNNTVNTMPSMAATHGVGSTEIVQRVPEITFNPEMKKASEEDFWTDYEAVTQTAVSYTLTNGTVDVTISFPQVEITNIVPADRNGSRTWEITGRPCRSAASAGEDEAYVQFAAS